MKSANLTLTRAPRPADPALTPAPAPERKPRTRGSAPQSAPACEQAVPAPKRTPKVRPADAPPLGRPPGHRVKKTVYVDKDLYEAVDTRYLGMLPEGRDGRFPLAVVLDEILRLGIEQWDEIAARTAATLAREKQ